ncbi:MAG: TolC family protein [Zetaproteobacteria bacterium CG06_land_8_20_14_3_00_59_53]|nr:MAG: hypothetical protein AUK36_09890 [Zetaproteobacteria bacterium CG2_30_59_37]PIO90754.1 MAG: transporter [Zetaproteobacteria bacterium CG23_combo_of_CG06-09_8_20_14_all_59_86]PIQ65326.1 MAG: transporter [Zetaproteobacteria bacterium CG11_big_fil_rev_8_21_14_0_20_59_439]PIU69868.1 MAG: TolC family protein [Zetaproteobacteria bacterium CG06_land_8_20_14_3_00_59_53]PIU97394.1 MAG: TolC family protein [Zetaproteobacteria bacterium CG03_land_8_20_14_0_80_59_51]PIY45694.1 MAG: TolC family pro
MHRLFASIVSLAFATLAAMPPAAAAEMTLKQVIQGVLENNPQLAISRTDSELAAADAQRIEGLLDTGINATVTGSDERVPTVSDFQAAKNRKMQVSGGISQPLKNGDTLGVSASYSRSAQGFNSPLAAQLARFNPAYRSQIDLTYRIALQRGSNRPDYAMGMQSIEAKTRAAELNEHILARNLALSALNAFYRLSADDINVDISKQAVKRARDLLRYQKVRQSFGLIEQADALQAEALLAARQTDLQRAQSARLADETNLRRLMRGTSHQSISLYQPPLSASASVPDFDAAEKLAIRKRPDLRALDAGLKAAESDLDAARGFDAAQVDMVAQLGSRSLDARPDHAAGRAFSLNDRYAALSVEMQDNVGRNTARAAIRKAELARQRIAEQRDLAMEQIRDDLAVAISAIRGGLPNLRMARLQALAEQNKYQAELDRYRNGRSDTATLVQFEGELRNAQLQERLQMQTLQLARFQMAWATGSLLENLGVALPSGDTAAGRAQP